jgi:catechol 2,3-dioxygenase-like lactoylglutathione lyase family enzyme
LHIVGSWLLASAPAVAPAESPHRPAAPALSSAEGVDHVLLWRRDVDAATAVLAVQLGFHVRPGGTFPDGVANRLVTFKDQSYLELLYFVRSQGELSGDALKAYQFAQSSGGGANSFALLVDDVDAVTKYLAARGFPLNDPDPAMYDPDGEGPRPAMKNMWRTVSFKQAPLTTTDLFFIRYDTPPLPPERAADLAALARHPNGATGISAVWLLSEDLKEDAGRLERMGFRSAGAVVLPSIRAKGLRFAAARESIILLHPDGSGLAADAVAKRGAHVYGVSVGVEDLGRAQRIVERGTGRSLARHQGPNGEAFIAPMQDHLGIVIEFHQSR